MTAYFVNDSLMLHTDTSVVYFSKIAPSDVLQLDIRSKALCFVKTLMTLTLECCALCCIYSKLNLKEKN